MSRLLLTLTLTTCAPSPPPPPPAPTTIAIEPAAPAASTTAIAEPAHPAREAPAAKVTNCAPIGVAPCDEYITRYSACIARMPESVHDTARQGLRATCDAWRAAAETPRGAEALEQACSKALEALQQNVLCKD